MNILVTGGAGYIGSHTVRELVARGHEVVVLDNLERGHAASLEAIERADGVRIPLVRADLRDAAATKAVVASQPFDGVVHFAAYCAAGESVAHPEMYFSNNVVASANLFNALVESGIQRVVFSSSCAVYGQPKVLPVTERNEYQPESPYGESKYLVERMLPWYEQAHGVRTVALRYFNAAGGSLDGVIGDDSRPASRLIPRLMKAILGKLPEFTIFGTDYPTPDGTCIRDYIHVLDLASAHVLALEYLAEGKPGDAFNVGVGIGYSNLEVVEMARRVSGVQFQPKVGPRRPGDPAEIFADNSKARRALRWEPRHSDLETIIRTDWGWHSRHPEGYDD